MKVDAGADFARLLIRATKCVGPALLLVRSSYRRGWHLPGGGVRRGEMPETAARRELAEEIGLTASVLLPAGFTCGTWDGRRDRVHFFELRLVELPQLQLDNREVIGARLMSPAELQSMVRTGPARRLSMQGRATARMPLRVSLVRYRQLPAFAQPA
jgi:8-oxo-dGTP pyrophosphatase MutT (NUDIX family)